MRRIVIESFMDCIYWDIQSKNSSMLIWLQISFRCEKWSGGFVAYVLTCHEEKRYWKPTFIVWIEIAWTTYGRSQNTRTTISSFAEIEKFQNSEAVVRQCIRLIQLQSVNPHNICIHIDTTIILFDLFPMFFANIFHSSNWMRRIPAYFTSKRAFATAVKRIHFSNRNNNNSENLNTNNEDQPINNNKFLLAKIANTYCIHVNNVCRTECERWPFTWKNEPGQKSIVQSKRHIRD